jgi:hypothetical protein
MRSFLRVAKYHAPTLQDTPPGIGCHVSGTPPMVAYPRPRPLSAKAL